MLGRSRRISYKSKYNAFGDSRLDHQPFFERYEITVLNASTCMIPEQFRDRLTTGLTKDHLCVGNDVFQVPKSCEHVKGSPLGYQSGGYTLTMALGLFTQGCGFGDHLISVRLSDHTEWLKSVLIPNHRITSAVHYVDPDLQEGDDCMLNSRLKGRCVREDLCMNQLKQPIGQIQFCSNVSVICCSPLNININRIHPDILNCPYHGEHEISVGGFHKALVRKNPIAIHTYIKVDQQNYTVYQQFSTKRPISIILSKKKIYKN